MLPIRLPTNKLEDDLIRPRLLQWLLLVGRLGSWNENEMPTVENSQTESGFHDWTQAVSRPGRQSWRMETDAEELEL
jgi:hypothetical protein